MDSMGTADPFILQSTEKQPAWTVPLCPVSQGTEDRDAESQRRDLSFNWQKCWSLLLCPLQRTLDIQDEAAAEQLCWETDGDSLSLSPTGCGSH